MPFLSVVTIPNKNGVAKDAIKLQAAFDDAAGAITDTDWWTDLLHHTYGTSFLASYMPDCMDLANVLLQQYDLAGHLDGSNHGSPVETATGWWPGGGATHNPIGNQAAAVFGIQSSTYGSTPTVTGTGDVPTPEAAIDMGAPATHTGQLKGKARQSGRMYFGPLSVDALGSDGNGNPVLAGVFLTDASLALAAAKPGGTNDHGLHWSVWSRRDAVLRHVSAGWVDHGIKTRRSREFVPHLRTTF